MNTSTFLEALKPLLVPALQESAPHPDSVSESLTRLLNTTAVTQPTLIDVVVLRSAIVSARPTPLGGLVCEGLSLIEYDLSVFHRVAEDSNPAGRFATGGTGHEHLKRGMVTKMERVVGRIPEVTKDLLIGSQRKSSPPPHEPASTRHTKRGVSP